MTFEEIEKIVRDHIDLIEINSTALAQGKDRAARFLVVEAILANHLKTLEEAKAQVSTIATASYAQAIQSSTEKGVTEKKISAEANPQYSKVREAQETVEAEMNWVKTHMRIFENAHVMFRQYTRE